MRIQSRTEYTKASTRIPSCKHYKYIVDSIYIISGHEIHVVTWNNINIFCHKFAHTHIYVQIKVGN